MPLKPLPDEVNRLKKEDTECSYCGISYLILHEVENLKKKITQLEEELKGKSLRLATTELEAREKLNDVERERDHYRDTGNETNAALNRERESLRELRTAVGSLGSMNKDMELHNKQLSDDRDHQEKELNRISSMFDSAVSCLRTYRTGVGEMTKGIMKTNKCYESLNVSISSEFTDFQSFLTRSGAELIRFCQKHMAGVDNEIMAHHDKIDQIQSLYDQQCREIEQQNERHLGKESSWRVDSAHKDEEIKSLRRSMSRFKEEKECLSSDLLVLKEELSNNDDNTAMLNETIKTIRHDQKLWEGRFTASERARKELETHRDALMTGSQEAKIQIGVLKAQVISLQDQSRASQVMESRRVSEITAANNNNLKHIDELKQQVEEAERDNKLLVKSHVDQVNDLQKQFRLELEEARRGGNIVTQLSNELDGYKGTLKELEVDNKTLKLRNEELQRTIRGLEESLVQKETQCGMIDTELQKKVEESNSNLTSLAMLRNQNRSKTEELQQLGERIKELEIQNDETMKQKNDLVQENHSIRKALENTQASNVSSESQAREVKALKEEILFLQQTVRNECLERAELMMVIKKLRSGSNTSDSSYPSMKAKVCFSS